MFHEEAAVEVEDGDLVSVLVVPVLVTLLLYVHLFKDELQRWKNVVKGRLNILSLTTTKKVLSILTMQIPYPLYAVQGVTNLVLLCSKKYLRSQHHHFISKVKKSWGLKPTDSLQLYLDFF